MKLLFDVPPGLGGENKFRYFVPFDHDLENGEAEGYVGVTDDSLYIYYGGRGQNSELDAGDVRQTGGPDPVWTLSFSCALSDISETKVNGFLGCGELVMTGTDGGQKVLCRFSLKHINRIGELSKFINAYIKEGVFYNWDDSGENFCPKCGAYLETDTSVCLNCSKKGVMVGKLLRFNGKNNRLFLVASLLFLAAGALNVLAPVLNRVLIDEYMKPMVDDMPAIIGLSVGMMLCFSLALLVRTFAVRVSNRSAFRLQHKLREACMRKIHILSMKSINRKTTGDLMTRVMNSVERVRVFFTDNVNFVVTQVFTLVGVIVIMLVMNPLLTLLVFLPVIPALLILRVYFKVIHARYSRQWRLNSRSNILLNDVLKGIRVVKTFGREEAEIARFADISGKIRSISAQNEFIWAVLFPIVMFVINVGELLVMYFGGMEVIGGIMTLGELISYIIYLGFIYGPIMFWARLPRNYAEFISHLSKVLDLLEDEEYPEAAGIVPETLAGSVEYRGVVFGYKAYEPVLKDIDVQIAAGEMVGIVGPSGVGKSTMINLLLRLYDVNLGSLRIDGEDIRAYDMRALRSHIGVVFQDTFLFAGTIYDNIAYAVDKPSPEAVIRAARIAGAHGFICDLPDGYDTVVGENGYTLSGGERQRLSIARAVLKDPRILILDEATSSLDTETERGIQEALRRLVKGRTTIAIAHRLSTLQNADRLIVLDEGKVAETGSHLELMKSKGIYYKLVMAQLVTNKMNEG